MMIRTCKNRLPALTFGRYISRAVAKSAVGTANPPNTYAHDRASGFFMCEALPHLRIMVGRAGEPQGSPGSYVSGFCSPVRLTTPEPANSSGELSKLTYEVASLWQAANLAVLNAAPKLRVSTLKQKLIAASIAPASWHVACILNPSAITVSWCSCACLPYSAIWLTIWRNCKTSPEPKQYNPSNYLTVAHSAFMRGGLLPAISPEGIWR